MTFFNSTAFTLIELLVVVLIIGILAAIALPQYNKAVEKSRATQALTVLFPFYQAQKVYFLENGNYALSFDELPVELQWGKKIEPSLNKTWNRDWRTNADWILEIDQENKHYVTLAMGRRTGKYRGAGFMYVFKQPASTKTSDPALLDNLLCFERLQVTDLSFTGEPGDYCQKIFKATPITSYSPTEIRFYKIP